MPLFFCTWNSELLQMVGKRQTFLKLPYLQNDKQQDGGSTNVCLRILLLLIKKGWIGQEKFGEEVNCNNFNALHAK